MREGEVDPRQRPGVVADPERRLGSGLAETGFPQRRELVHGRRTGGELATGVGPLAGLGGDIAAPVGGRGVVGELGRGEVGLGLLGPSGHHPGDTAQATEFGIAAELGMQANCIVEDANGFVGELRSDQEPRQRQVRARRSVGAPGFLVGDGGKQLVVTSQEAAGPGLGPVRIDEARHGRGMRRVHRQGGGAGGGGGRREAEALRPPDGDQVA